MVLQIVSTRYDEIKDKTLVFLEDKTDETASHFQ